MEEAKNTNAQPNQKADNEQGMAKKVADLLETKTEKEKISDYLNSHKDIIFKGWGGVDKELVQELMQKAFSASINTVMALMYVIGYRRGHRDATDTFIEKWSNPDKRQKLLDILNKTSSEKLE